jgi:Family of unknown function (DUF5908)
MTIEIRELIVRAQVGPVPVAGPSQPTQAWVERLRRELLAEVKALVQEQQRRQTER